MALSVRNDGGLPFLALEGNFVVRAKQMPDGDTVAFAAASSYKARSVKTNVPVDPTGQKSVNLRLQSIDAPEKAQPRGAKSRDRLLRSLGFDIQALQLGDDDFNAGGPTQLVPGWLLTHGLDNFDRPLSYLLRKASGLKHGSEISAAEVVALLKSTENYKQVSSGAAYPAFYENTDEAHALVFQAAAQKARKAGKGVWASDATTRGFVPTAATLGSTGALVYPKFFRRVQDWKTPKADSNAFIQWLKAQRDGKKLVVGAERDPLPLWKLFVAVSKTKVAVPYDVTKLWFSE